MVFSKARKTGTLLRRRQREEANFVIFFALAYLAVVALFFLIAPIIVAALMLFPALIMLSVVYEDVTKPQDWPKGMDVPVKIWVSVGSSRSEF